MPGVAVRGGEAGDAGLGVFRHFFWAAAPGAGVEGKKAANLLE